MKAYRFAVPATKGHVKTIKQFKSKPETTFVEIDTLKYEFSKVHLTGSFLIRFDLIYFL